MSTTVVRYHTKPESVRVAPGAGQGRPVRVRSGRADPAPGPLVETGQFRANPLNPGDAGSYPPKGDARM